MRLSEPPQLSQALLGQVVSQNGVWVCLREQKGRNSFPARLPNSKLFPEGQKLQPLAVALSKDIAHQVEAFFSHLLSVDVGEFSFYFNRSGSSGSRAGISLSFSSYSSPLRSSRS